MDVVTGALPSVIAKLGDLLFDEHRLDMTVRRDIMVLQMELGSVTEDLEMLSSKRADQLDGPSKTWASGLRELSYDIEDSIDKFMVRVNHNESAKLHGFEKFTIRSVGFLVNHKIRREFAAEIKDMKNRVVAVQDRRRRFGNNLLGIGKPTLTTVVDPSLFVQYRKAKELIGIDERRDELIKVLMDGNGIPSQQGKIVSVFGTSGVGKTTLAKAVYNKIRRLFDCCAFVSCTRDDPDFKKLLKELLYGFGMKINNTENFDERQLINVLREFLESKRYFIVIDEVWNISIREMIESALPGGYIIIITRILDIANSADIVYKLAPLSYDDSRKLLYRRIFGYENNRNNEKSGKCPYEELDEISERILQICDGIPLAITMLASLLACKAPNKIEWYEVYRSIQTGHQDFIRSILVYCYYIMPFHLRTCLLYLAVFPKDCEIVKHRLIWMWTAEGFIKCDNQRQSLFELGESYFNELINRSMIEPIYATGDIVYGCRVHDMVHDFLYSLSSEENFVTILNSTDHISPSEPVRRLSLQIGIKEDETMTLGTTSLKQVRSAVVFPSAISLIPPILGRFKVLRVLELQDCDLSQGYSLKYIGNLLHLRYLGLRCTRIAKLPEEIENLQFLQVLDVQNNSISSLPSTVVQLRQLMCLHTDQSTRVPNKIGSLTNLQELSTLCIDNYTMDIIEELGQLIELRVLKIILFNRWNSKLVKCLCKLQKMQDLSISYSGEQWDDNSRLDAWVAPRRLRSLNTRRGCWFSMLPSWMNPLLLRDLTSLSIAVRELDQDDLEILGELPSLCCLDLTVNHEYLGITEKLVISSCLFPCLVECRFFGFLVPVMFQQGAMLRLASIEMEFQVKNIRGSIGSIGLGNLPAIQDVTVLFKCSGASEGDIMEAEAAVRHEVDLHPSRPTLRIITDGRDAVITCERGSISSLPSTSSQSTPPVLSKKTSSQSSHVKEAREKRDEYKIDGFVAKPVKPSVFQYMKGADLVGIEKPVNEIIMKILTGGNEMSVAQGKIVSIVGPGGLGKTTLAHAIYGKLRAQFDCWAFVSVSQNPDMVKLFKCIMYQLGKKNSANIHEEILDERLLIYELAEFLHNRRYFIVIDDIQDISVWRMIECALPASNDGCIIITTTRISDVATQVGGVHSMKHLFLEDSRKLLHRRIFGTEDKGKYIDDGLIEISEKILQRCGGIPLAIIMISGLLASKGKIIEWHKIYMSMKFGDLFEENMKTIVSLCYEDLPSHLKTCLLYLSVFPKGYDVDKDHLIRLWIDEGLIQCGKQDESPFVLGDSYFQELINRCMIQPVHKRWYYDMRECCHVHDIVLDHISEVADKEKLVSVWNHMNHTSDSQEVQWLSLQNSISDHATHWATMNMQGVRSVFVFPSAVKVLPDLARFRDLLVLDLRSCCLSQGCSLKHLGNLVHLRYLGLRDTGITHLSEEIGKLRCLQTLDVRRNEISSLPSALVELKHLMCLLIDSWTRAPNGIGSFTSLEELSTLCIQDSTDMIEELSNLTEMRVLGIDCCTEWNVNEVEKSLVNCLHKLQKIQTLSISMVGECNLDAWVAPEHLRRLELTGCWPSTVPAALLNNPSLLLDLSFLSIEVRKLRQEDLESLGRLPALSYLDIEVGNQKLGTVQTFIIGGPRSFPCLVHCTLRGYIGPVAFRQGAMPEVARLHLAFPMREIREAAGINGGGFDLGLGNLPRLQDVSFLLRRGGASKGEVEEAEAKLRQAIEAHPNRPTLEIL